MAESNAPEMTGADKRKLVRKLARERCGTSADPVTLGVPGFAVMAYKGDDVHVYDAAFVCGVCERDFDGRVDCEISREEAEELFGPGNAGLLYDGHTDRRDILRYAEVARAALLELDEAGDRPHGCIVYHDVLVAMLRRPDGKIAAVIEDHTLESAKLADEIDIERS